MQETTSAKQLRSFGLMVGGVFAVIGLWPLLFGRNLRLLAVIPAAALLFLGIIAPRSLCPVYRLWMKLGHVLGTINTKIILTVTFYGLFMPMGFIMRRMGKDPMRRGYDSNATTYRVPSSQRPGSHMLRQF